MLARERNVRQGAVPDLEDKDSQGAAPDLEDKDSDLGLQDEDHCVQHCEPCMPLSLPLGSRGWEGEFEGGVWHPLVMVPEIY